MDFIERKIYIIYIQKFKKVLIKDVLYNGFRNISWDEEINDDEVGQIVEKFNEIENVTSFLSRMYFTDYLKGIYKNDFTFEIIEYKDVVNYARRRTFIEKEGLFCKVVLHKDVKRCMKIKINQKENQVDGEVSKEITQKIIEFGNQSKMKFDVLMENNIIYFKFKTMNFWEPKRFGDILDELMIKEFLNILFFIINISNEIANQNFEFENKL